MSFAQNQALEQSEWNGHTDTWQGIPRYLEFQSRDWGDLRPEVLDIRIRRAAAHAIDRQAIVDGFDWVDVETDIAEEIRRFKAVKRIVSYHNLREVPANLEQIHERRAQAIA